VTLTDSQLDRYARHIVLREIGGEGQRKLLAAKVAIIGAVASARRPSSI
jgi:adenylyltransferase/sulfurtransferase